MHLIIIVVSLSPNGALHKAFMGLLPERRTGAALQCIKRYN